MLIQAEITELSQSAVSMQARAQEYAALLNQLQTSMRAAADMWKGEDSQAFLTSTDNLMPSLQRLTVVLEQYSQFLNQTAQVYAQLQADRAQRAGALL